MTITLIFMVVVMAIALFNTWVIFKKGKQESISAYIIRGSKQYPLLVLLAGIVLRHPFWPMRTDDIYKGVECVSSEQAPEESGGF